MIDYIINPVLMGGVIRKIFQGMVKVYLDGRLGVITVPERLIISAEQIQPEDRVKFYFSYLQIVDNPYDYDSAAMNSKEVVPVLLGGTLVEVNDTAVKAEIMNQMGYVAVPRRWVFTNVVLKEGQSTEFYLSPLQVIEKESIALR